MRYATVSDAGGASVAVVDGDRVFSLDARRTMNEVVAAMGGIRPDRTARVVPLADVQLGPAVPYPGAIYTVGDNYRARAESPEQRPSRPLIYGKAASSVGATETRLSWHRTITGNVDPEVELGVVIGRPGHDLTSETALDHVFGYTIVNDISSRDPWLDGDQWLLGKSMPGFCPVGPWIVSADELDPADLRLGCTINGEPIQDGRTSEMRFSIAELVAFLSRHVKLRPGDLIATGTPVRLPTPPGPDRHLEPGDVVTARIEGIGQLTTRIE
jgi:2-keto-4-pentenoate hydratase/2-oxohepta-3-ene-1,7-dioic acid hydratase in catechol pathway